MFFGFFNEEIMTSILLINCSEMPRFNIIFNVGIRGSFLYYQKLQDL